MANPRKLRVAVLFGGRSAEHEVSLLSARFVVEALDRERFEPVLVGIGKDGRWHLEDEAHVLATSRDPRLARLNAAAPDVSLAVHPTRGEASLTVKDRGAVGLDVVFPCSTAHSAKMDPFRGCSSSRECLTWAPACSAPQSEWTRT